MTDTELLQMILSEIQSMKTDISELKNDVSELKTDVSTLKADTAEIKDTVNKNYGMLEEFYVYQKEHNTEVSNSLAIVEGELEMHNNQIAINTAQLKRLK